MISTIKYRLRMAIGFVLCANEFTIRVQHVYFPKSAQDDCLMLMVATTCLIIGMTIGSQLKKG